MLLPRMPELFFDRHNNKVAFVDILKYSRYNFYTMLQGFTMHHWHPRNHVQKEEDVESETEEHHFEEMQALLKRSRRALEKQFGNDGSVLF